MECLLYPCLGEKCVQNHPNRCTLVLWEILNLLEFRHLREFSQWEDHRLRETLEELVDLEHVSMVGGGGRGTTIQYRLVPESGYGLNLEGLTTPDELEARMAAAQPKS